MKTVKLLLLVSVLLWLGTVSVSAHANATTTSLTSTPRASVAGPHNAISADRAEEIAHATDLGLTANDMADLRVTDNVVLKSSGARVVYFQQTLESIGIYNGVLNVTVNPQRNRCVRWEQGCAKYLIPARLKSPLNRRLRRRGVPCSLAIRPTP